MKLNKNSWHARFYKKSYVTEELPKTICNYFWSMFFAIVLLPITWWGYLLSDKSVRFDSMKERCGYGFLTPALIFMSGVPFVATLHKCGVNLENINIVLQQDYMENTEVKE